MLCWNQGVCEDLAFNVKKNSVREPETNLESKMKEKIKSTVKKYNLIY